MSVKEHWEQLSLSDWEQFAQQWLAEIRGEVKGEEAEEAVVAMNFTARPELQWQFILIAISFAKSDEELGHIASGPMEHLLGWHGKDYIQLVEEQAASDPKFAKAMQGVWKYMMTDEVWERVQAIQSALES